MTEPEQPEAALPASNEAAEDTQYPEPASLPKEGEPIDFETAKGCVAHYAATLRKFLSAYLEAKNVVPYVGTKRLLGDLGKVAERAYCSKTSDEWIKSMHGHIHGSEPLGSFVMARRALNIIQENDKSLSTGHEDDKNGSLTLSGLTKLQNGLSLCVAAMMQHFPQGNSCPRSLRPYQNVSFRTQLVQNLNAALEGSSDNQKFSNRELRDKIANGNQSVRE